MSNEASFRRFQLELEREEKELFEGRILQVTRLMALQALRGVVRKSPIATGHFRSNWFVDVDGAGSQTQEGSTSEGVVIARGSQQVSRAPVFTPVAIYNNLPYAERLENGWSLQAPQGMVSATVAEIRSQFRRVE